MSACGCAGCAGQPLPSRWRRQPEILAAMLGALADQPPLAGLRARTLADPSIALCDAWAVVLDILGFHAERIAAEGYLATACERRSLVGLARLVGYAPRPGVAASALLAFEIDANTPGPVELQAGLQVNSLPGPGETMVTFETAAPLVARAAWNAMPPRRTRPQGWADVEAHGLWLDGAALNLKTGDPLLVRRRPADRLPGLERIHSVQIDAAARRTRVVLAGTRAAQPAAPLAGSRAALLGTLRTGPRRPPRAGREAAPPEAAEANRRLFAALDPVAGGALTAALGAFREEGGGAVEVWALRVTAPLFGHDLPWPTRFRKLDDGTFAPTATQDWTLGARPVVHADPRTISLAGDLPLVAESWLVVETVPEVGRARAGEPKPGEILVLPPRSAGGAPSPEAVAHRSLPAFNVSLPVTELRLPEDAPWLPRGVRTEREARLTPYRAVRVHAGAEPLTPAPMPLDDCVEGDEVELDGFYDGLEPGRVVVVAGPLCGLRDAAGGALRDVPMAEAARIAELVHRPRPGLGDTPHTWLRLAAPLRRAYDRARTVVHGNVAAATHGAVREQVLGGGDPAGAPQAFQLRPPPLGHVAAPVVAGAEPTLELRVDGVRWRATPRLAGAGPRARAYRLSIDEAGAAEVLFGDGRDGARPPRGEGNIVARWRDGLGPEGNVRAGGLALPAMRPAGLKGVTNPIAASGGAGPDPPEALRMRIPIGARAPERLVSVEDYADVALNFAGIAKARAVLERGVLRVTVAAIGDVPLDPDGELLANLRRALVRLGDPDLPVEVAPCERLALILGARLLLDPDHRMAEVSAAAGAALRARLGFEAMELGQDAYRGTAIAALQGVRGVVAAEVTRFAALSAEDAAAMLAGAAPAAVAARLAAVRERLRVGPAQLCALLADTPEALLIEEMPP